MKFIHFLHVNVYIYIYIPSWVVLLSWQWQAHFVAGVGAGTCAVGGANASAYADDSAIAIVQATKLASTVLW